MRQVKNILPLIFYFRNLHDKVQPQAKVENVKRFYSYKRILR